MITDFEGALAQTQNMGMAAFHFQQLFKEAKLELDLLKAHITVQKASQNPFQNNHPEIGEENWRPEQDSIMRFESQFDDALKSLQNRDTEIGKLKGALSGCEQELSKLKSEVKMKDREIQKKSEMLNFADKNLTSALKDIETLKKDRKILHSYILKLESNSYKQGKTTKEMEQGLASKDKLLQASMLENKRLSETILHLGAEVNGSKELNDKIIVLESELSLYQAKLEAVETYKNISRESLPSGHHASDFFMSQVMENVKQMGQEIQRLKPQKPSRWD